MTPEVTQLLKDEITRVATINPLADLADKAIKMGCTEEEFKTILEGLPNLPDPFIFAMQCVFRERKKNGK